MSFIKTYEATIQTTSKQVVRKKIRQAAASPLGGTVCSDTGGDFVLKNGYLYTVVRAISARVNQNYDSWPSHEIRTAAHTFVGKPIFVNHQNSDPKKARGRVVAARYVENGNDKYIECIMEIDAARFPLLADEIRTGGLDSVSMGAEAGHTICSMCGNTATDTHDMCDHVRFHKGEHLMKHGKPQLVFESCHKLGFFELSYVFDPADETAVVSKVIQANRTSGVIDRYRDWGAQNGVNMDGPIGNREAPPHPDNPQWWDPAIAEAFLQQTPHQPEEVEEIIRHLRMDPEDADWLREGFGYPNSDLDPRQASRHQGTPDEARDWNWDPEDRDKWEEHLRDYRELGDRSFALPTGTPEQSRAALADEIERADHFRHHHADQSKDTDMGNSVIAMIRQAYGETEAPESVDTLRQEDPGSEEDFHSYVETPAELRDPNLDRTQQLDREQETEGLDNDRLVEDIEGWEAPDHARNEMQQQRPQPQRAASPVNNRSSSMNEGRAREDSTMGRSRSSLASRGKDARAGHQQRRKTAEGPLTDGGDQSVNAQSTREPGEEEFITPTPSEETVEVADGAPISNTENNLVARMQHTQQQLLRDAARYQELQAAKRRKQAANPGDTALGSPTNMTQPAPPVASGTPATGPSLTQLDPQGTLTASQQRTAAIAHKIAWMQQRLGRTLTADESATVATSVPETADVVNPALSGTDDQSLKGSDFQPADPNSGVQTTQPQDSRQSNKIWAAFDNWLLQGTGRTARQHSDEGYVLHQAKRFADHHRFNPQLYFPTMGDQLRQIRRANMQRQADTSLDLAAPGGRVDVEAPTSNTTDAEAQASQFPIDDFGRNAGDGVADPDLSTDYVTWAPDEGKKEGFKRASAALAVRCADLWVESGLKPPEERYNLITSHETMRAGQVADRIAMLELFKDARITDQRRFHAAQRRVASGISRGAAPAFIPQGLTGATRTAGSHRTSALEDQSTDGLLFI